MDEVDGCLSRLLLDDAREVLRREVHQGSDLRDGAYAPASHAQQVEEETCLLAGTG